MMFKTLGDRSTILLLILVLALGGALGGIIHNLWIAEFRLDPKDKFDIFASLLTGLLTVIGLGFVGFGFGTFNILSRRLEDKADALLQDKDTEFQKKVDNASRALELRLREETASAIQQTTSASEESTAIHRETLRREGDREWIQLTYELTFIRWELGTEWEEENPERARRLWEAALRTAKTALIRAESLPASDEWGLVPTLKNLAAWLCAHLKTESDLAYRLCDEIEPFAADWRVEETRRYVRYRLPTYAEGSELWQEERRDTLAFIRRVLTRHDIRPYEQELLRRWYELPEGG